jgi:hypothetical protein
MKRFKRPIQIGLCVGAVALATNAVRLAIPGLRAQVARVTPYTVVLAETVIGPDGQRKAGPTQTWAVRSDGSTAIYLGRSPTSRTIQFASGTMVIANDILRRKSTMPRRSGDTSVLDPRQRCTKTIAGHQPFDNQPTVVEETVVGYSAVRISQGDSTSWYALDFGCAPIRQRTDFGQQGASEKELVTLIPGEPAPAIFALPEDYKEGPPSSLQSESGKCGSACAEQRRRRFERLDAHYYEHHR